MGVCNEKGYGIIHRGRMGEGNLYAHRVAWELAHGPLPPDKPVVRHYKCDNPPCCNETHLRPGTQPENVKDMRERGRAAAGPALSNPGERNGRAKLTKETVLQIRTDYRRGSRVLGSGALSKKYGVTPTVIRNVVAGRSWKEA
jgi:hypothetical protein